MQRGYQAARLFMLSVGAVVVAGCPSIPKQAQSSFSDFVRSAQFEPTSPPSTRFRAGYMYTVLKTTSGGELLREVCEDLAKGQPAKDDEILLFNFTDKSENSAGLGLSLLKDVIKDIADASLTASVNRVANVTVTSSGAKTWRMANKPEGQVVRTIPSDCANNLKTYVNADGTFRQPVYLVAESLSMKTIDFKFDGNGGAQLAADLAAANVGKANIGFKSTRTGDASVKYEAADSARTMYFGTKTLAITSMTFLSEVAAASQAQFGARTVSDQEVAKLSSLRFQ